MGQKGAKLTEETTSSCEAVLESLASVEHVTSRKMFGGYGIFQDKKMFALITSDGILHFKVSDRNRHLYEDAGAKKFGRMPYYEVPNHILDDHQELLSWAAESVAVAHEVVQ